MDNTELKAALLNELPVILTHADGHEGEYKCVSAVIYRKRGRRVKVSAEIQDRNGRSVVICDPAKLRFADNATE